MSKPIMIISEHKLNWNQKQIRKRLH